MNRTLAAAAVAATLLALPPTSGARAQSVAPKPVAAADTAVFAGGCFWGIEGVFEHLKGVTSATSGYAGGTVANPSYEQVSSGETGHAESVQVVYDPSQISYGQLLPIFFSVHDPTLLNRQGPDEGPQYRSSIFYSNDEQKQVATAYIAQLNDSKVFKKKIATTVVPLQGFYQAEDYHQNYLKLHPTQPYIVYNDLPKLDALKAQLPELMKPELVKKKGTK